MTTTGPVYPGTVGQTTTASTDWTDPGNAASDNDSNATVTLNDSLGFSEWLLATNFDFSAIPDTDTISAVMVEAGLFTDGGGMNAAGFFQLIIGGSQTGNVPTGSSSSSTETTVTNATAFTTLPTVAQAKASNFGVAYRARDSSEVGGVLSCDWIRLTLTHAAASAAKGSGTRNSLASTRLVGGGGLV